MDFYFRYSYQRIKYKIPVREILYFESNKRKVLIVTEKETFVVYSKLSQIQEGLKNVKCNFCECINLFL